MMMAGNALAVTDPVYVHDQIILRGPSGGGPIYDPGPGNLATAFSVKETCGHCHNGGTTPEGFDGNGNPLLSYDQIERHSYHAQLGANNLKGWNVFNLNSADKFKASATPRGKNWNQSLGHFGKW
jgi:hypothetical protein